MKQLKYRIIIFIIIAIGCGWIGKAVDFILGEQKKGQSLGILIWMVFPFIASVLLAILHKSEFKSLGLRFKFKKNGKWYVISFIIFPVIAIFSVILGIAFELVDATNFSIEGFVKSLCIWFIINFLRTILEEAAWRGFLQERLMLIGVKDIWMYIIISFVWSCWHIPYYLFFYEENAIRLIIVCFILLFSWSILFTEIYRITRTIWPCVLLHGTSNAIQYTMLENYLKYNDKWNLVFSPTNGIVPCIIIIGGGFLLRKVRIKQENL